MIILSRKPVQRHNFNFVSFFLVEREREREREREFDLIQERPQTELKSPFLLENATDSDNTIMVARS